VNLGLRLFAAALLAGLTVPALSAETVLTNCAQAAASFLRPKECASFDLVATVCATEADDSIGYGMTVCDRAAAIAFEPVGNRLPALRRGDTARFRGSLVRNSFDEPFLCLGEVTEIVHGPAPEPTDVSPDDLKSECFDNRLVRVTGVVRNVFPDDIDPHFQFLLLTAGRQTVYIAHPVSMAKFHKASELIGALISVTGICRHDRSGLTQPTQRRIERQISPFADGLKILSPPQTDFSPVPDIVTLAHCPPEDISLDWRYRARGRILAVQYDGSALLRHVAGTVVRVRFAGRQPPPVGASVEIVGFPESNLFVLGLTNSIWHPIDALDLPMPDTTNMTARALMEDTTGRTMIKAPFHGRTVRLSGIVKSTRGNGLDPRMILESDGYLVPIDPGPEPDLLADIPVGSRIAVTGTCVMDIDDWRPTAPFPRVHGFSIVLRTADDVTVLSRPPWWTPARLAIVLFSILGILLVSALLNIVLRQLVERRSRQLEAEIGARVSSESKVKERTRLAVELHDAISQNLTGVAFQLQTVGACAGALAPTAAKHLAVAERTLGSCRDELRNCLWDLRNNALECADINEAIRQTLAPHIGNVRLSVRFEVARARFTDNFAHALLHIIRELTANAVRHGHASRVKVAGCVDKGRLLFSVSDDGCGFDPENCPGFEEGHFGLMGIRERMDGFEGELSIESNANGTKVTASMAMTSATEFRETT